MQQGKTDVCLDVINLFIKNCEAKNKKYEVIYLINIADNDLKGQTKKRVFSSGFLQKVHLLHHANLKDGGFEPNSEVEKRLIIIDECHIALERSNHKGLKPFHEFLKKCGINYGQSIDVWNNKENYVLSVSATPYATVIQSLIEKKSFEPVVLKVPENYYSLQKMSEDNRFRQSASVVKNGKITSFLKDRLADFIEKCKIDGNGYMVIRATGAAPYAIVEYIKNNLDHMDILVFESEPVNNIAELDSFLNTTPSKPCIAIIRGSCRAGKTLTTTKNIRMWFEPPSSKTDTMCQVVGRSLGYEMIEEEKTKTLVNRKFQDKFIVYCNIKEIHLAIKFYDNFGSIPTGVRNKKCVPDNHILRCARWNDIPLKYKKTTLKGKPAATALSKSGSQRGTPQDLLFDILLGYSHGAGSNTPHIWIDKAHESYPDTWKKALNIHPEWETGEYYISN